MTWRRISDSAEPAARVSSGEPLWTIAIREPRLAGSRILEIRCSRKSSCPSLLRGRPGPNRPSKPRCACSARTWDSTFVQSTLGLGLRQHPAGSARAIEDAADGTGIGERGFVAVDQQVDHQAHDLARREMLARRFVARLPELADELLEDVAHLEAADPIGV
jgi:hypothetical protein